ncbi:phosphatase PAP2 family protein [Chitinophaga pollutisoli]|uniref:Phosphatase PAP2 family protein n=1 Tax=Chitinophaga pollutisoli TaxID=3133966 RepID=A0ABZ2YPB5_9BACT
MYYRIFRWQVLLILLSGTSFAQEIIQPPIPVDSQYHMRPLNFRRALFMPASFILAGVAINGNGNEGFKKELVEERNEHIPTFQTHIDNYLQYAPIAIVYGLDAAGISSRTDIRNRTAILIKGEALMSASVSLLKNTTHQLRPDGSTYNSFPSGHTAQAFAAATFLSEEYKHRFPWMPYAAYGMASAVGGFRMANNRHYVSDVLVGAGIGILSMKMAYWTHQYKWRKRKPVVDQF